HSRTPSTRPILPAAAPGRPRGAPATARYEGHVRAGRLVRPVTFRAIGGLPVDERSPAGPGRHPMISCIEWIAYVTPPGSTQEPCSGGVLPGSGPAAPPPAQKICPARTGPKPGTCTPGFPSSTTGLLPGGQTAVDRSPEGLPTYRQRSRSRTRRYRRRPPDSARRSRLPPGSVDRSLPRVGPPASSAPQAASASVTARSGAGRRPHRAITSPPGPTRRPQTVSVVELGDREHGRASRVRLRHTVLGNL